MKKVLAFLCFGFASLVATLGQVTVDVVFDQTQFVPSETLIAKVRITNFSGRTLHLGHGEGWLSFDVEGERSRGVPRLNPAPVEGPFELGSSEVAIKKVNLAPYFDLSTPGRYKVTATVQIPELQQVRRSEPVAFDIVSGTVLWELNFGLPASAVSKAGGPPEIRKYALLQVNHLPSDLQLYFRLSNAAGSVTYQVYPVGRLLSFSRPEPQVDQQSRLHLLYQDGAKTFKYLVFDPEGKMVVRETYYYTQTRPTLRADSEGNIKVLGGARYLNSTDLPKPTASASPANDKVHQP